MSHPWLGYILWQRWSAVIPVIILCCTRFFLSSDSPGWPDEVNSDMEEVHMAKNCGWPLGPEWSLQPPACSSQSSPSCSCSCKEMNSANSLNKLGRRFLPQGKKEPSWHLGNSPVRSWAGGHAPLGGQGNCEITKACIVSSCCVCGNLS